jgi:hypothetical protein
MTRAEALLLLERERLDRRREREWYIYWLLRCYQSGHREGWEEGPSVRQTMDDIHNVLCNAGYDPAETEAQSLMKLKFGCVYSSEENER